MDGLLLITLGCILLYFAAFAYRQPRAGDQVAYWQKSVVNLDEMPDRFFAQVFQRLREGLNTREVALTGMGFGPQKLFENRSIFSHRPLYLCAQYKHLTYYLYVSQTPVGLFLSTWMYSKFVKGSGEGKGIATLAARRYFAQQTMFQHDALLMFQESVHSIVLEVLDRYMQEQGLKPLEEYERRPIYHAFYSNAFPPRPNGIPQVNIGLPGTTPAGTGQPGIGQPSIMARASSAPTPSPPASNTTTPSTNDNSAVAPPATVPSTNAATRGVVMPSAAVPSAAVPQTHATNGAAPLSSTLSQSTSPDISTSIQAILSATSPNQNGSATAVNITTETSQDEDDLINTDTVGVDNSPSTADNIIAHENIMTQHLVAQRNASNTGATGTGRKLPL
ncbi:MAG TPA: hypothetical protein VF600_01175 [Abditibacteriaceae bacterium]